MRRFITIALAALIFISIAACSTPDYSQLPQDDDTAVADSTPEPAPEPTPEPTTEPTPESPPAPTPSPAPAPTPESSPTPGPAPDEMPVLRIYISDHSEAVKELQTLLNGFGVSLSIDGNFGGLTEAAVRGFQLANSLPDDGVVGTATWTALHNTSSKQITELPTPRPAQPPPPSMPSVEGTAIIIGDSITVDATAALQTGIPGLYINAANGRKMSEGYSIIMSLQDAGVLPETVIVALGTNDSDDTDSKIKSLIKNLKSGHRLLFIVPYSAAGGGYESALTYGTANYIRSLPGSYGYITISDWAAVAYNNSHLIDADKVHIRENSEARNLFVSVVANGLSAARSSPVK